MISRVLTILIFSISLLFASNYKDEKTLIRIDDIKKGSKKEQLLNSIKFDNLIITDIDYYKNFAVVSAEDNSPLSRKIKNYSEYNRLIILTTLNNGKSWEKVYAVQDETTSQILIIDEKTVVIISGEEGEGERILVSNDSGNTWNTNHYLDNYTDGEYFNKIFKYKDQIYISVLLAEEERYIVLKSDKMADNWQRLSDDLSSKILKEKNFNILINDYLTNGSNIKILKKKELDTKTYLLSNGQYLSEKQILDIREFSKSMNIDDPDLIAQLAKSNIYMNNKPLLDKHSITFDYHEGISRDKQYIKLTLGINHDNKLNLYYHIYYQSKSNHSIYKYNYTIDGKKEKSRFENFQSVADKYGIVEKGIIQIANKEDIEIFNKMSKSKNSILTLVGKEDLIDLKLNNHHIEHIRDMLEIFRLLKII